MPHSFSNANSIKLFFDKLGTAKPKDQRSVRTIVSDTHGVSENSAELDLLIFIQLNNFEQLFRELTLSSIGGDAKKSYEKQLRALASILRHPLLYQRYDSAKEQYINPNYPALTYLHDHLGIATSFSDDDLENIERVIASLKEAADEVVKCNLPLRTKSVIYAQISRLIFMLSHIGVVGIDQAWEAASAAYLTIEKEAATAKDEKGASSLTKLAVRVAAVAGIIIAADQGLTASINIASRFRDGYEFIEGWRRGESPKIEHKKTATEQVEE
jgi:hypothetical protein